ncbi:MAG: type II toxin-antitoxin system HigB family toxin [Candidatus Dormibacteraeota bacterium]|nr:type II toxin-antitoxin system HigB family toxin [Candidatus Dormibacteraeota bacterium]MDQ6920472.1 type II toxin-antitoxin system HigB family toxin [Candidatus Dormibacteraeota bacterium]
MRVVSRRRLREFWQEHPQAQAPLAAWFKIASKAQWRHLEDVRSVYPSADAVEQWTVFNIGGNDFRLVTRMVYRHHLVYVETVLTHAEYDKGKWQ